eukprot:916455-Amphidinium_carterae.1
MKLLALLMLLSVPENWYASYSCCRVLPPLGHTHCSVFLPMLNLVVGCDQLACSCGVRLPTLGLSLAYIFIVTAQVQLALSDRSFLRARGEYWAKAKYTEMHLFLM